MTNSEDCRSTLLRVYKGTHPLRLGVVCVCVSVDTLCRLPATRQFFYSPPGEHGSVLSALSPSGDDVSGGGASTRQYTLAQRLGQEGLQGPLQI